MGVMDRVAYARGGYSGGGSGPAPGVSSSVGLSASFGGDVGGSGDVNVQATGVLLVILAVAVFFAAKGLRVG
jgi:hypothetical protein